MNKPLAGVPTPVGGGVPQPVVPQPTAPVQAEPQAPVEPIKDRTQENFEKLLDSNNRLFQQQQAQQAMLDQLLTQQQQRSQQQTVPQAPVETPKSSDVDEFSFVDPVTGERFVKTKELNDAFRDMRSRTEKAESTTQNFIKQYQVQQREMQEREAFAAYPELNPRSQKFDPKFASYTRAFLTDSMLNQQDYEGQPLSFKAAADLIRAGFQPTQQQQTQSAAVAQAVNQQQAVNAAPTANQRKKEQASATIANQPPQAQADITQEELSRQRLLTRLGDEDALAERLGHTEHVFDAKRGSQQGQP